MLSAHFQMPLLQAPPLSGIVINSRCILDEEDGKTLITITVVPFNASEEETRIFAGGINGMKMGFGASFKGLADYLTQRS